MTLGTVALTLVLLLALGTGGITAKDRVGRVHFATSCRPAVKQDFERAVAMLHWFWFSAPTSAFTAVAQSDPACGIAHWGVAMNLLGNPFGWPPSPKALADGWAAVERAKAAGAKTQRERDYVGAIEMFYKDADKIDHRTRALAYRQAMEQLAARYPEDREAAVFYALALNATALPTDKTYADQLKAAAILETVFAVEPNHPGVAHYLIHSYDYPPIAEKGLNAASRYAEIAPSAPHALHMPSHIFTRVGAWEASAATNRRSVEVSRAENEPNSGLHATEVEVQRLSAAAWTGYAKGNRDEALTLMRSTADLEDKSEKREGPPARLVPSRELLGEMLLELKRSAEALKEFEASERHDPNRFRGIYGPEQAAAEPGDNAKAKRYSARLADPAGKGEPRPEIEQAKAYLAKNKYCCD